MFHVYILSQHKIDAYRQVKFEPYSYTSVDINTPRPTSDHADYQILPHDPSRPHAPSDQLQSEATQQQTKTQSSSQFPGSYVATVVKFSTSQAPLPPTPCRPLTTIKSPHRDFLDYTQESDSESERGPDDSLPGPSPPPHQSTSTSTPAAPKSSRTIMFDMVPETSKLSYDQRSKRDRKQTQWYFEHGFARLVAEP